MLPSISFGKEDRERAHDRIGVGLELGGGPFAGREKERSPESDADGGADEPREVVNHVFLPEGNDR
jgi:hypothetical protein